MRGRTIISLNSSFLCWKLASALEQPIDQRNLHTLVNECAVTHTPDVKSISKTQRFVLTKSMKNEYTLICQLYFTKYNTFIIRMRTAIVTVSVLLRKQYLWSQCTLCHHATAGNTLLSAQKKPIDGREGYIMDIEFSHTDCSLSPVTGPDEAMTPLMTGRHTHFDAVKRRVAMMGTAQFMAYEVLDAINGNIPLVYDCHHDIESFIWVLCYTVGRCWVSAPGIMDSDRHERLCEFFHDNFGCDTLYSIMQVRTGLSGPLDIARRFPEIVSPPLVLLFGHLRALVYAAHAPPHSLNPAVALTYDVVLDLFITTIKELMGS